LEQSRNAFLPIYLIVDGNVIEPFRLLSPKKHPASAPILVATSPLPANPVTVHSILLVGSVIFEPMTMLSASSFVVMPLPLYPLASII
jgi:hypothetical protein